MNYFTPDLYVAMQGRSDAEMDAADAAWEEAADAYSARYDAIRQDLPEAARQLQEGHYLHDAKVLSLGADEGTLVLSIAPETPGADVLTLIYSLDRPARIDKRAIPEAHASRRCLWLYDEVDRDEDGLVHRLLLSNGWAIDIHYRDLRIVGVRDLLREGHRPLARPA